MGKVTTYIMIMSGVTLLMYFGGVIPASPLLDLLLTISGMKTSSLYTIIGVGIAAVTAALSISSALIGGGNSRVELVGMWIIAAFLLNLGFDFVNIYLYMPEQYKVIGILLFSPFMVLWMVTIVEWWRGVST